MSKLNTVQNGKGSRKRPTDLKKFNSNYDQICWSTKTTNISAEQKEDLK